MEPDLRDIENAFLKKEIQHRVRNNIQVISSLLRMQTRFLDNHEAESEIKEANLRVSAMGMAYDHLYNTHEVGKIDIAAYLDQVVNSVISGLKLGIKPNLKIETAHFSVEIAIPLGLIINELFIRWHRDIGQYLEKTKIILNLRSKNTETWVLEIFQTNKTSSNSPLKESYSNNLIQLMAIQLEGEILTNKFDSFSIRFPYPISRN